MRGGWRMFWHAAVSRSSDPQGCERRLLAWTLIMFGVGCVVLVAAMALIFAWAATRAQMGVLRTAALWLTRAGWVCLLVVTVGAVKVYVRRRRETQRDK